MTMVLVCTVGGSDAPIIHAVEQNQPAFVFFLCSGGSGPGASAGAITGTVASARRVTCPECGRTFEQQVTAGPLARKAGLAPGQFEVVTIEDPDSLDHVIQACESIERTVRQKSPEAEVVANYTGGSKTMSVGLALYAVAVTRGRWQLQVNAAGAGRTDLIRVETGDTAVAQDGVALGVRQAREEAEELERRHDYDGGVAVLEAAGRSLGQGAGRQLAPTLQRLRVLAAWDRLSFQEALGLARTDPVLAKQHGKLLRELRATVELLGGDSPWPRGRVTGAALVEDLVANARRWARRRRFDEAFGRLYRATELVAQVRLRRAYGVSTSSAETAADRLQPEERPWLMARADGRGVVRLGLVDAYDLLARLGDPLGLVARAHRDRLLVWLDFRNCSLFAHGLTPIDRESWVLHGEAWSDWVLELAGRLGEPSAPATTSG